MADLYFHGRPYIFHPKNKSDREREREKDPKKERKTHIHTHICTYKEIEK